MTCPKCKGTGWWAYDHNHSTRCDACCTHDKGRWLLTNVYYGYKENHINLCCLNGCGHTIRYPKTLENEVRYLGT